MNRRLVLSYVTITVVVLLVLEVPFGLSFGRNERDRLLTDLERDAFVLGTFVEDALEQEERGGLATVASMYADRTGARVVIVDAGGESVVDTSLRGGPARDFANRPEIADALRGERASGIRPSETFGGRLVYVAVPISSGGHVHGAVRLTYPAAGLEARVRQTWITLGVLAAVVIGTVALIGWLLARSISRSVRQLDRVAASFSEGDLSARAVPDEGPPELRSLARRFNDTAARLQELVDGQRAFVADASHQLRTPLTALRLRLENLQSDPASANRLDLEAAIEETGRLARLVEQLLALARAEGTRPEVAVVDPGAVAVDRRNTWAPLAEERGVHLRYDGPPVGAGPEAETVPGALDQILDNLLANALDVSPEGSSLTIVVRPANHAVQVHVIDGGPGMTAEERARAFDRFWRANGTSPASGTGLGLAIVRQLARAGGGEAFLDQAPGGGLDAWVRLRSRRTLP